MYGIMSIAGTNFCVGLVGGSLDPEGGHSTGGGVILLYGAFIPISVVCFFIVIFSVTPSFLLLSHLLCLKITSLPPQILAFIGPRNY